jgi:arginine exporter protein ArgO
MKSMEEIVWWALIAGNLSSGALLTYIFLKWANVTSFGSGASAAAAIGFFMSLSMDLVRFATSNSIDLTASLTDVVVGTVMTALAGGAIGAVLGMSNKS